MCLMRLKYRKIFITILLVVEIMLVNLTYQSFLHREINKEENKITKKQFAMYIKENDEYVEYEGDNLFPKGYYVNKILSKCVDEKNNPIEIKQFEMQDNGIALKNSYIYDGNNHRVGIIHCSYRIPNKKYPYIMCYVWNKKITKTAILKSNNKEILLKQFVIY